MKFNNTYYILRHGESLSNAKDLISSWPEKGSFPLTEKGRKQIKAAAKKLKKMRIDFIFASPLLRTKQTAAVVAKELKIKPGFDKRLREYDMGIFNGKDYPAFKKIFPPVERYDNKPPKGETYFDIESRIRDFLKDAEKKYNTKNILIISHQVPLTFLEGIIRGFSGKEILKKIPETRGIETGELKKL